MILSDRDIRHALEEGRIRIDPMPDLETSLGSVSIDFRLGTTFMVFEHSRHSYIDPRQPQSIGDAMRTIECSSDEPFMMQPGDFALASTVESLELPDNLLGRLEGRSSIARLGITSTPRRRSLSPAGWHGDDGVEQLGADAGRTLSRHAYLRLLLRGSEFASVGAVPDEARQQVRRSGHAAGQFARRREPDLGRTRPGLKMSRFGRHVASLPTIFAPIPLLSSTGEGSGCECGGFTLSAVGSVRGRVFHVKPGDRGSGDRIRPSGYCDRHMVESS